MIVKSDTDFQRLFCICPVEDACLLWEYLESTELLTLWLHDVKSMESSINHQVARLEADKFREAKWLRKETDNSHDLKQAARLAFLSMDIFDADWLRLKPCQIEWHWAPFRVADTEFDLLWFKMRIRGRNSWAFGNDRAWSVISWNVREENDSLQLILVRKWSLIDLKLGQDCVVQRYSLLCIKVMLEVSHLDSGLWELGQPFDHKVVWIHTLSQSLHLCASFATCLRWVWVLHKLELDLLWSSLLVCLWCVFWRSLSLSYINRVLSGRVCILTCSCRQEIFIRALHLSVRVDCLESIRRGIQVLFYCCELSIFTLLLLLDHFLSEVDWRNTINVFLTKRG